jgi:predicted dehydrogenase
VARAGAIRVGLVGFGLAGRAFHAPFIATNPRLQLTHVVTRRATAVTDFFPGVRTLGDVEGLLALTPRIDLVVIATPNATHAEIARGALQAGRHVVIDKPFTVTSEDGRRLAELADTRGLVLSAYHNRRWDGDFLTLAEIVRRGWIGAHTRFESRFDRFRPEVRAGAWREQPGPGSGLLFDLGPHLIDQALVLFGRPRALSASIAAERPGAQADDHFEITLHYQALEARLGAGMLANPPGPRFRISGVRGSYEKHGVDPQEELLRAGCAPAGPGWGEEPPERWGVLRGSVEGLEIDGRVRTLRGDYGRFYDNVCDAIEHRAALAVTAEQAVETVRAIELAFESSRAGAAVLQY